MKTVLKYPLQITDEQFIELPEVVQYERDTGQTIVANPRRQLLHVAVQNDEPCLWAFVSQGSVTNKVKIITVRTGKPSNKDLSSEDYIGTYQLCNGALVFHVFFGR